MNKKKQITRVPEYFTYRNERYKYHSKSFKKTEATQSMHKLKNYGYKTLIKSIVANEQTTWYVVYKRPIAEYKSKNPRYEVCKVPSKMNKEELARVINRVITMSPRNRLKLYSISSKRKHGREYGLWKENEHWGYSVGAIGANNFVYADGGGTRFKNSPKLGKGIQIENFSKSDLIWILKAGPYWQDYCY